MTDEKNSSSNNGVERDNSEKTENAAIVPISSGRKTETFKKKKIDAIKQAFEQYLPLNKPKKNLKKSKKDKRKK
jgi:hypothetical protein